VSTKKLFFLILLLGFLFRLFLLPQTFNTDLIQQAEWGQKTFQQGTTNFYSDSTWIFSSPNHPPIAILLYKTDYYLYRQFSLHLHQINFFLQKRNLISPNNSFCQFVNSFDQIVSPEKPFRLGYLLTLKLIPILSDILIAFIIFKVAQKKSSHPLIYPTLFLFMPFSWYISSLWGQTDQLSFLFLILAFISLPKKPTLSIILFYLSIAIKPTGITLLPLFLFLLWKNKTNLLSF
jgi:Gpi18-like mannosyltransferase